MIDYDIRTVTAAKQTLSTLMGLVAEPCLQTHSGIDFDDCKCICCGRPEQLTGFDLAEVRVHAFHVTGSVDDCQEIKRDGLINLQAVLKGDTIFSRALRKAGIKFDLDKRSVLYCEDTSSIDYECLCDLRITTAREEALKRIARRVYIDYCVNGFLSCDEPKNYGTVIHKRPEFLKDLAAVFPRAEKLEKAWISQSKAYRIDFYATIDQIASFTFEPSVLGVFGPPCDADFDLDEETRIKRWLILRDCDMANGYSGHEFVYIRDDVGIPPNQITSYTLL